jgi:hypothetical protein
MKKPTKKTEIAKPAKPDWLDETPRETEYLLLMNDGAGESQQEIDMTREEFIALKRHLATIRRKNPTAHGKAA